MPCEFPRGSARATPLLAPPLLPHGAVPLPRSEERRVGKECRYWRDWSSDVCSSDLIRVRDLSSRRGRDGPAEDALDTIDAFEGHPESEREAAYGPCRANSHAAAREPRPSSLLRCCRTGRYHCRDRKSVV